MEERWVIPLWPWCERKVAERRKGQRDSPNPAGEGLQGFKLSRFMLRTLSPQLDNALEFFAATGALNKRRTNEYLASLAVASNRRHWFLRL